MKRLIALATGLAAFLIAATGNAQDLIISGARIYRSPDSPAIPNGVIVIRDGRIVSVGSRLPLPRDMNVVDATGLTAVAGFWNSHVHILTPDLLDASAQSAATLSHAMRTMFTRWGFTTVFDIASVLDNTNIVRERIASGEIAGPQILTTGDPFYPEHGTPVYVRKLYETAHLPSAEVATAGQAVARVDSQIARGADGAKIFTGAIVGGDIGVLVMDPKLATAIAAETHRFGKPVFAHPSNLAGTEDAIESGVDILAHTAPMAGPWRSALIEKMLKRHMALIPTLSLFEVEAKKFGESDADLKNDMSVAEQQLGLFWRSGGQILFGTDIGYTDAYDTHEEMRRMAEAGLGWRAILASLTTNPAKRFGTPRKGTIAAGMDADIVLLGGDPARNLDALSDVRKTIRNGTVIYAEP